MVKPSAVLHPWDLPACGVLAVLLCVQTAVLVSQLTANLGKESGATVQRATPENTRSQPIQPAVQASSQSAATPVQPAPTDPSAAQPHGPTLFGHGG